MQEYSQVEMMDLKEKKKGERIHVAMKEVVDMITTSEK